MVTFDEYAAGFGSNPGFLDWAEFAPLSPSVLAEVLADAEMLTSGRPASFALSSERLEESRRLLTDLLGGRARLDQVVLQPSTTHGLMHAFFGMRGVVLASAAEHPAIGHTLERAVRASHGALQVRRLDVPDAFVTPEAVAGALDDDVTALAVSHVDFRTGYRTDLRALRDMLGPDRLLVVDAAQSFGIVDDDFLAADVVAAHGYKWLRAGRGTGFAWFSDLARERIEPVLSGSSGTESPAAAFEEVLPPSLTAQAYSMNHPDPLAVARLATALGDVRDVGVAAIAAAIEERVQQIFSIAERLGVPVLTPSDPAHHAGIVALAPEEPAILAAQLANAGVSATARGSSIRLSVHAGTDDETLSMLEDAISSLG